MAIIDDITSLDFAYKGYQYPLPPTWKRAIRLEDQINWLLQAFLALNDKDISAEDLNALKTELTQLIKDTETSLTDKADKAYNALDKAFKLADTELQNQIKNLTYGLFLTENPVTGSYDYAHAVFKQMYDIGRNFAITYGDIDYLGEGSSNNAVDSSYYLTYADIDNATVDDSHEGIMFEQRTFYPVPMKGPNGRMATAEVTTDDKLTYITLDTYSHIVVYNCMAEKNYNLRSKLKPYLNVAFTPIAAIPDKAEGYNAGISLFTTYGEMDANGVLGYKERN